ncbi:hypothetical protein OPT61_g8688 [Boeremia exigua]|uniref:Uncharacterized protein n=1 Tax=Boeremia exigua TaxID=749465 RepID=A0ACC2HXT8_9PLEO|nr:hypothetical protein OPT61_g8688 [Boeremia exigua]
MRVACIGLSLLIGVTSGLPNLPVGAMQPNPSEMPAQPKLQALSLAIPSPQNPLPFDLVRWLYDLQAWLQAFPQPPDLGLAPAPPTPPSSPATPPLIIPGATTTPPSPPQATQVLTGPVSPPTPALPPSLLPTQPPILSGPRPPTKPDPRPIACSAPLPGACWQVPQPSRKPPFMSEAAPQATAKPPAVALVGTHLIF